MESLPLAGRSIAFGSTTSECSMTSSKRKPKSSPSSRQPKPRSGSTRSAKGRREVAADWFEYRLEHHPEFVRRVSEARASIAAGKGILEEV